MDQFQSPEPQLSAPAPISHHFTKVTLFSKILAGLLFITLPFVGFFVGSTMYPQNVATLPDISDMGLEQQHASEEVSPYAQFRIDNDARLAQKLAEAIAGNEIPSYFTELGKEDFIYKGQTGSVRHLCMGVYSYQLERDVIPTCLGVNALVLDLGGDLTLLATSTIYNRLEERSLRGITFNETQTDESMDMENPDLPESEADGAILIIGFGEPIHEQVDAVFAQKTLYAVTMSTKNVHHLTSKFPSGVSLPHMEWNAEGTVGTVTTKAIGDAILYKYTYNLETDTLTKEEQDFRN